MITFVPVEERFICDDCEYKCLAFNDVHTKKHILVRVVEKVVETVVSTEDRLRTVEGQLESVQGRLEKMERLLSKLLEKGGEGSTGGAPVRPDIEISVEPTNPESNDQEGDTRNLETASTTTSDK